jgi:hypothetical protein
MKRKSKERKELEADVVAFNSPLRKAVRTMDAIQLIRNCHPLYREDHARKLLANEEITKEDAYEFKKGVDKIFQL